MGAPDVAKSDLPSTEEEVLRVGSSTPPHELAAAIAQRKLDAGSAPADIALLVPDEIAYHRHLRRAFAEAGIRLSGLALTRSSTERVEMPCT